MEKFEKAVGGMLSWTLTAAGCLGFMLGIFVAIIVHWALGV